MSEMRKRGDSYDQEAIDMAFSLYCQGLSHEKIECEMRKVYPGWSRQLLYDRKTTPLTPLDRGEYSPPVKGGIKGGFYPGWITRFNWEERRAEADRRKREREEELGGLEETMIHELLEIKKTIHGKIQALGGDVDSQLLYAHVNVVKLILDTAKRLGLSDRAKKDVEKRAKRDLTPDQLKDIEAILESEYGIKI